jgi:hypothetical protein
MVEDVCLNLMLTHGHHFSGNANSVIGGGQRSLKFAVGNGAASVEQSKLRRNSDSHWMKFRSVQDKREGYVLPLNMEAQRVLSYSLSAHINIVGGLRPILFNVPGALIVQGKSST